MSKPEITRDTERNRTPQPASRPDHPWAVRGVSQKARHAATDAARQSGMLLGPWLERVVLAAAGKDPQLSQAVTTDERPAERLVFSKRELLLTSWSDCFGMPPSEQARFAYQRGQLERELRNQGKSPEFEAAAEFQAAQAEAARLRSVSVHPPRRKSALAPV